MSRLIVVSNRVTPPSASGEESVGGLAMALAAALREYSGLWFGWSGKTTPEFTGQLAMQKIDGVTVATVDLEDADVDEYYNGYANKTLWPLFHYRSDLTAFDRAYGEGYERVNRRFAETLRPLIEPNDLVWIHDYHLIPLARELRRLGVKNRMGFFLHVPWPAYQLITTLPGHRQLVQAMFDYDLLGFQTAEYQQAFEEYVLNEADGEQTSPGIWKAFGRTVRIGAYPIGIDAADFAKLVRSQRAVRMNDLMRACTVFRRLIIGVDRLDYSKGLEERFLAYEDFLGNHPDALEGVSLLQIATPSRDEVTAYQDIRARLDAVSGRINGAYATADWVPIRYVNRTYRRDELAGMYRAADVGLVTPLRDGMNLVAKEYVAAQDPSDPGVLVLSQFAGAAEQLGDALIVNPFSREDMSDAIQRALTMPRPERLRRWERLMEEVRNNDVTAWRDRYVQALEGLAATPRLVEAAAH